MTNPLSKPSAILFDWDNTLVDSWEAIYSALTATLTAMGQQPWTDEEARLRVRSSLRDAFPKLFGERWTEARDIYLSTFAANHLAMISVMAGAAEFLELAKARQIPMAVVSNKTGRLLRLESTRLGWDGYFHRLVGAQDTAADKPDPGVVTEALAGMNVQPQASVWLVGDAAIDMDCAKRAGCSGILIGTPPAAEDFSQFQPTLHVMSLNELIGYLDYPPV